MPRQMLGIEVCVPKQMLGIEVSVPKQLFRHRHLNPQQKCHPDRSVA
jgi:hypothetical protein